MKRFLENKVSIVLTIYIYFVSVRYVWGSKNINLFEYINRIGNARPTGTINVVLNICFFFDPPTILNVFSQTLFLG